MHATHFCIFIVAYICIPIWKTHSRSFVHSQVIMYIAFIAKFGCPDSSKFLGSDKQVADYDIETTKNKDTYSDGTVKTYDTHKLKRARY